MKDVTVIMSYHNKSGFRGCSLNMFVHISDLESDLICTLWLKFNHVFSSQNKC